MKKLLICLVLFAQSAFAQTTLILPVSPGGIVHSIGNEIIPFLEQAVGNSVSIEFKPGATGIIGANQLISKNGKELTLMLGAAKDLSDAKISQLDDMIPIAFIGTVPSVIITSSSSNITSLKQFLEYSRTHPTTYDIVKDSPNPPLLRNLFATQKIAIVEVPAKSGSQVILDVVGGQVNLGIPTPSAVIEFINAHRLNALAVFADKRSEILPTVPTVAELGLSNPSDFKHYNNFFLWANKTSETEKLASFTKKLNEQLNSDKWKVVMKKLDIQQPDKAVDVPKKLKSIIE